MKGLNPLEYTHFGIILVVVGFAIFAGIKKFRTLKHGEPAEDELSKKILRKTAAVSYYISLYIWVFLMFIKDRAGFETEEIIGTGILGMALTFGISWFIINFTGPEND
jgi:peptidoglycan/LPS O-acetylase OafA/YrhL